MTLLRSLPCLSMVGLAVLLVTMGCKPKTDQAGGVESLYNKENKTFVSRYSDVNFTRLMGTTSASLQDGATGWHPWSGYYWPSTLGGIALRWIPAHEKKINFDSFGVPADELSKPFTPASYLNSEAKLSASQWLQKSETELSRLSPAEKWDLLNSNYDLPTVKAMKDEMQQISGLSFGMGTASLFFHETVTKKVTNHEGVLLPFYAEDIKALIGYFSNLSYTSEQFNRGIVDLGSYEPLGVAGNCNIRNAAVAGADVLSGAGCKDVNAGAFFVALVHQINKKKQPLFLNLNGVTPTAVVSYSHKILQKTDVVSSLAPKGTKKEFKIETALETTYFNRAPELDFNRKQPKESLVYTYTLHVDANENIIGGEWLSQKRPDSLWLQEQKLDSSQLNGTYKNILKLVKLK